MTSPSDDVDYVIDLGNNNKCSVEARPQISYAKGGSLPWRVMGTFTQCDDHITISVEQQDVVGPRKDSDLVVALKTGCLIFRQCELRYEGPTLLTIGAFGKHESGGAGHVPSRADCRPEGRSEEAAQAAAATLIALFWRQRFVRMAQNWRSEAARQQRRLPVKLGDLRLLGPAGSGGQGRVRWAEYAGNIVAVKFIRLRTPQHVQMLLREKECMQVCQSPFVVGLVQTWVMRAQAYICQEACEGSLCDLLWQHPLADEAVRFSVACALIALGVCRDRRVIHRDLKSSNLLVAPNGYIKLGDFGLARRLEFGELAHTLVGTPGFFPPECGSGQGYGYPREIWSVGVLAFELTFGYPPFDDMAETQRGIASVTFECAAKAFIHDALQQVPWRRPTLQSLRQHTWFAGLDWESIERQDFVVPRPPVWRDLGRPPLNSWPWEAHF